MQGTFLISFIKIKITEQLSWRSWKCENCTNEQY